MIARWLFRACIAGLVYFAFFADIATPALGGLVWWRL